MTIPDFSKRLTTARGRIEHNDPGARTSIGPADVREMIKSQERLTTGTESAKVSQVETPAESQPSINTTLASESPESSTSEPGNVSNASETPQVQASGDENV